VNSQPNPGTSVLLPGSPDRALDLAEVQELLIQLPTQTYRDLMDRVEIERSAASTQHKRKHSTTNHADKRQKRPTCNKTAVDFPGGAAGLRQHIPQCSSKAKVKVHQLTYTRAYTSYLICLIAATSITSNTRHGVSCWDLVPYVITCTSSPMEEGSHKYNNYK